MDTLHGRTALLTGAAGGIGQAMARALVARGAVVALVDRDAERLERFAAGLSGTHSVHPVDLTERSALGPLVEAVVATHGGLDLLICNAGLTVHGRFADLSPGQIDTVLEVDLGHVLHLVSHALPALRERPGAHIVLVSSMAGLQAFPHQAVYSAAKHGIRGFGAALRFELSAEGIGVSTLLPGTIATGFLERAETTDVATSARLAALMQRWGTSPDRVARAMVRATLKNRRQTRVGWDCWLVSAVQWVAPPLLPLVLGLVTRRVEAR